MGRRAPKTGRTVANTAVSWLNRPYPTHIRNVSLLQTAFTAALSDNVYVNQRFPSLRFQERTQQCPRGTDVPRPESVGLYLRDEHCDWIHITPDRVPPLDRGSQQKRATVTEWVKHRLTRICVGPYQRVSYRGMELGRKSEKIVRESWCLDICELKSLKPRWGLSCRAQHLL